MPSKTKRKTAATAKRPPVRPAVKAEAPAPALPAPPKQPVGAKGLLRAGLKALNDAREDAIARQSRVFEALLGLDKVRSAGERAAREVKLAHEGAPDAPGMQKFEEVFDQRVARSLERLGMPSPQALAALCRQLEAINEHLARIEAAQPKRAPRRRPPRA